LIFFNVRKGLIGVAEGCRAMVFRCADEKESRETFEHAGSRLAVGKKFSDHARQGDAWLRTLNMFYGFVYPPAIAATSPMPSRR
jgi:hypothetical protein